MIIRGKERGFELNVQSHGEISELCENKDFANFGKLFGGTQTENLKMDVLATFLYRTGFSSKGGNHYGRASAIGVILVILCLLATAIINKLFKTENYEM
jgi:ABC-type sugar transport system permease subunit